METRTCADLNKDDASGRSLTRAGLIEQWREEMAAQQPGLEAEAGRELETHLLASIAELQGRGLNDEESFWLARRRLGQPSQIAQEFAKNDSASVWRQRVFWLVLGVCAMRIWTSVPVYLLDELRLGFTWLVGINFYLPEWVLLYLPIRTQAFVGTPFFNILCAALFNFAPFLCLLILLARGRLDRVVSALRPLYLTRWRFVSTAAVALLLVYSWAALQLVAYTHAHPAETGVLTLPSLGTRAILNALFSAASVALAVWLLPSGREQPAQG